MDNICVSVIMPVYNAAAYIPEALRSLLSQDCDFLYEIVCVDDCSTDNSYEILKSYAEIDDRVIVLGNKTNQGCAKSRNLALNASRGEYITFVDADDYVKENFLRTCFHVAQKKRADIVLYEAMIVSPDEQYLFLNKGYYLNMINKGHLEYMLFITNIWCTFIKREILVSNKIEFDERRIFEDWIFLWKVYSVVREAVYINMPQYYYRVEYGDTSLTTKCKENAEEIMQVFDAYREAKNVIVQKWREVEYIGLLRANEIFMHFIKIADISQKDFLLIYDRYYEFLKEIPEILYIRLYRNGLSKGEFRMLELIRKGDAGKKSYRYLHYRAFNNFNGMHDAWRQIIRPFHAVYKWGRQIVRLIYNVVLIMYKEIRCVFI